MAATAQSATRPRVVGFGDNVVDRFLDRRVSYPGGNSVNFAVFAAQLGAAAAYLGVFGTDALAAHLQTSLTGLGVALDRCQVKEGETGWCDVIVVDGDRVFGDWNGGGVTTAEPFVLSAADLVYLAGFDLVHSGVYGGVEDELFLLRQLPALVSFDFSDEKEFRTPAYLDRVCPNVDLAVFSCEAYGREETEALVHEVHGRGVGLVLATSGLQGSLLYDGRALRHGSAVRVDAVDTMGCGDAFATAFAVTCLQQGWQRDRLPSPESLDRALRLAAHFSAEQCLVEGAFGHGKEF
ncbi:Sugar or nucleoside kinase, ribokinase family [Geodermatophilus telluris]|uniref:Sugar or nucleoside kinase, ribokinase family n=1 Tax=Geodermatophilus telluris TaxID=1190417 RepID=A0A1G6QJW6_9ACTN|nr:PfkB family carbohydrate kinase [Geodermatophilus telluris]SDC92752.1 Sugar or nucleoside kinase, ribokinase family [Geodermatophilus telluris]